MFTTLDLTPYDLAFAHRHSIRNRREIERSELCGCFYCIKIFDPSAITEWIDDGDDETALCPFCPVDSVIGAASGFPIEISFLERMRAKYF